MAKQIKPTTDTIVTKTITEPTPVKKTLVPKLKPVELKMKKKVDIIIDNDKLLNEKYVLLNKYGIKKNYSLIATLIEKPIYGNRGIIVGSDMENKLTVIKNGFSSYEEAIEFLGENKNNYSHVKNFAIIETYLF